jgi:AbrB family looped-hinge helix DNA binding protein
MDQTTVSSKYQVVIPKSVREQLNLRPGQKLVVLVRHGVISLVPVRPLAELRGFAPDIRIEGYREEEDRF